MRFLCRLFRKSEAFVWAAIYLRNFLPQRNAQRNNQTSLFTAEETEMLRQALTSRLKEKKIRKIISHVPYLSIFLSAWAELSGDDVVSEWASETSLADRDFLQMLLNFRTAVSSSNQGEYLKLNLDHVNRILGMPAREKYREIKSKQIASLSGMILEIEDAILMNEEH
ncbi:hypothetical protein [Siccibacter turicensis]|uniref:hypothetical protein n=1 Tax=Siccibacter turicensis TaxID=357233 RepID=UPI001F108EB9|nr:hypothetical protein [Siccibacter turicensis]